MCEGVCRSCGSRQQSKCGENFPKFEDGASSLFTRIRHVLKEPESFTSRCCLMTSEQVRLVVFGAPARRIPCVRDVRPRVALSPHDFEVEAVH